MDNATEGDKYSLLEAALIRQLGLTKAQKAKKLASFTTLDPSMTPTTLLMHMRPLSSDSTSEEFIPKFESFVSPTVRITSVGRKYEDIGAYAEELTTWPRPLKSVSMCIWLAIHPRWTSLGCVSIIPRLCNKAQKSRPHVSSK